MNITELHDRLFEVLCVIDDICKEENIPYFLDSGTAIGAVREKDFIPWDDDMDIKILAENYPRFKEAMKKNLPAYMHLVEPQDFAPGFYDFIVRIYDERYFLREETDEDKLYNNYQNHVGTDVFIFAKAPNSNILKKTMAWKLKTLYGMGMTYRCSIDYKKYSAIYKCAVFCLQMIGKIVPISKIFDGFWKIVFLYSGEVCSYRFPVNYIVNSNVYQAVFRENWYSGEPKYGTIRGRQFPIPSGYHEELSMIYGDYMTPDRNPDKYVQHLAQSEIE